MLAIVQALKLVVSRSAPRTAPDHFHLDGGFAACMPTIIMMPTLRFGNGSADCVGYSSLGMFVPARILVVIRCKVLSHLHHREHAAQINRSEWSRSTYHLQCILWYRHLHLGHLRHATLTHGMVVRNQ